MMEQLFVQAFGSNPILHGLVGWAGDYCAERARRPARDALEKPLRARAGHLARICGGGDVDRQFHQPDFARIEYGGRPS